MASLPIIIDCDPGQDDAIALLTALASPELDVLGVTAVHGNVPLVRTSANAQALVEFAGKAHTPVFAGSDRPLQRPVRHAVRIHGASGLRGWNLPEPRRPLQQRHAVEFLVETLRARDDVTFCALGPLTNLAAAFTWAPEIARRVRRIVFMGGGAAGGNVTPAAEFNIHTDPEAAAIVLAAGAPVVMAGLHLTWQAITTPERLAAFRARGGAAGRAAAAMYDCPERYDFGRYGGPGLPLHDPCVIAYVLRPELFGGRDCFVAVETEASLTLGQTVVDRWGTLGRTPNVHVLDTVDADGYFALLTERLARLSA
jgi:purine nucleosidase